jgi:hypothetical protein
MRQCVLKKANNLAIIVSVLNIVTRRLYCIYYLRFCSLKTKTYQHGGGGGPVSAYLINS